tara:strand:+ start:1201 stop:1680 length:480 start_codon:yes stop_codon:yes gene_type:complete
VIKRLDSWLERIAKVSIVLCVFSMLFFSVLSIVLRWFEVSLLWIEPLVRHLVFLAAFIGGSLATGSNQHIKIDLMSRILEKVEKPFVKKLLDIFILATTLLACAILVKASYELAVIEFDYGKVEFLGIHSGYLLGIIPVGMSFISLRVLTQIGIRLGVK